MDININNYENWAVDYLDGLLTPSEMEVMNQFFEENPELLKEVIDINNFKLEPDVIKHPNKKSLLRRASLIDRKALLPLISSAAAVVAFLTALFFIGNNGEITGKNNLSAAVSVEHPGIDMTIPGGMANSQVQVQYQSKQTREEVMPIYKIDGEMKDAKITVVEPAIIEHVTLDNSIQAFEKTEHPTQEIPTIQMPSSKGNSTLALAENSNASKKKTKEEKIKQLEEDGFGVEGEWAFNTEDDSLNLEKSSESPSIINTLDGKEDVLENEKLKDIFKINNKEKEIKELPKKDE